MYTIIRFYQSGKDGEVVETGLTLLEVMMHCKSEETSSKTCTTVEGMKRTEEHGPWFEGFTEE